MRSGEIRSDQVRKPQVKGGPGVVLGGRGVSWRIFGEFLPDFGGVWGPKKKSRISEELKL